MPKKEPIGEIEVNLFSLKTKSIAVFEKTKLFEFYEQCVDGVKGVSAADVRLFRDEESDDSGDARPVDQSPADHKKKLSDLKVEPGMKFKLWWASQILTLEDQELLSNKIRAVFKKPLGPCIYRGAQHGWSRDDFENHCALKGPLVFIIHATGGGQSKSQTNRRKFGGFLSVNIEKDVAKGGYRPAPYSFLFNLGTKSFFEVIPARSSKGVFFSSKGCSSVLSMGGGDLCVYENANDHEFNFVKAPQSYDTTVKAMLGHETMYFGVKSFEAFSLLSAFSVK